MKNYYEILEIDRKASSEVIEKAYKVLAKKYHPDVQDDANIELAESKFKEIGEAYEILSDSDRKFKYDFELEQYQKEHIVNMEEYKELILYCKELEEKISQLQAKPVFNATIPQNSNNSTINTNTAVNKAYHDTYINTLKNMGYHINYKKNFKWYFKNFISLILTIVALLVIGLILWIIPSTRGAMNELIYLFKGVFL